MKKIIILSLVSSAIVLSCHRKAIPEIGTRTNFPPAPKSAKFPVVDSSSEAIAAGKTIFETKCNRCHDLKDTKGYTSARWTTILQTMIPRARLTDDQALKVRSYIMANCAP